MPDDQTPLSKPKTMPKPSEAALPDQVMAELERLAERVKATIKEPPHDIAAERSGQLSPPHTPGRGR